MDITNCTSTLQVIECLRAAAQGADCDFSFTQLADTLERTLRHETDLNLPSGDSLRNCDIMVTPATLRRGWACRCEYGTPCCPFEYALEKFYKQEGKNAD